MKRIARYVLFQVPGWGLLLLLLMGIRAWTDLPSWAIFAALGAWILKDALLYPLLKEAYGSDDVLSPSARLVGKAGTAEQDLDPEGYVRVRGELWRARTVGVTAPLRAGSRIRVHGLDRNVLLVDPDSEA